MKRLGKFTFAFVMLALIIHGWLWHMNENLYKNLAGQEKANETRRVRTIKEQRLALEAKQRKELHEFRVIDERNGYAEIPLERAFDYYLRSLRP